MRVKRRLAEGVAAWELALLGLGLLLVLGVNVAWVQRDGSPPFEHSGRSIRDSVVLWQEGWPPTTTRPSPTR